MNIVTCGIDLAKNVFQVHGIDAAGQVVCRKQLRRNQVLEFFTKQQPCLIGMEACGGAHYWARELSRLGHTVRLMSPQHVKPYIKGNKNDANDAAGICEAVTRPSMRFVGIKTQAQQDILLLHRIREQKVKARTALVNQIRGLLAEYGYALNKTIKALRTGLLELVSDQTENRLSELARRNFYGLYEDLLLLDEQVSRIEKELITLSNADEDCKRLMTLPGVGYITASALVAHIGDVHQFKNGRELAAYLGLVPRQHSSGGKQVLLGISKRGDKYLRTLLVHGSRTVLRYAERKEDRDSQWLKQLEARRGKNKATVAQANKTARKAWALLARQTNYQLAA
jgi:transposase